MFKYSDLLIGPDYWARHYGVGTENEQQEWGLFLRRRDQVVDSILQRMRVGSEVSSALPGVRPEDAQSVADIVVNQQAAQGAFDQPEPRRTSAQLLGAADFYGIENPERMTPDQLVAEIQRSRDYLASRRFEEKGLFSSQFGFDILQRGIATILTAPSHEVIKVAQRIPFIGDALAKTRTIQDADRWLSMVEEAYRGDLVGSEVTGWNIAQGLGGMIGYAVPATAAWKVAGALGGTAQFTAMGARMSPIARAAIQGGVSTWMLEGGGDLPVEERALRVGAGAGFAGVTTWGLTKILARLQRNFRSRYTQGYEPEPQYEFEGHIVPTPRALLGAGDDVAGAGSRRMPTEAAPDWEIVSIGGQQVDDETRVVLNAAAEVRQAEMRLNGLDPETGLSDFRALRQGMAHFEPDAGQAVVLFEGEASRIAEAVRQAVGEMGLPHGAYRYRDGEVVVTVPTEAEAAVRGRVAELTGDEITVGSGQSLAEAEAQVLAQRLPTLQYQGVLRTRDILGDQATTYGFTTPEGLPLEVETFYSPASGDLEVNWIGEPRVLQAQRQSRTVGPHDLGPKQLRDVLETVVPLYPGLQTISGMRVSGARPASLEAQGLLRDASRLKTKVPVSRLRRWLSRSEAAGEATTLSKHTAVMESPALADMAQQSGFTDADVVRAATATNPGEISIIRNISELDKVTRTIIDDIARTGFGPSDLQVVVRPDGPHLLVSDGLPLTPERTKQYRDWGLFAGQRVTTKQGQDVVVVEPGLMTKVEMPFDGKTSWIRFDELMQGRSSFAPAETLAEAGIDASQAYEQFRDYAMAEMMIDAEDSGLRTFGWLEPQVSSQLPRLIEQFLGLKGVQQPGLARALTGYFNIRRVEDLKLLAADEFAAAQAAADDVNAAVTVAQAEGGLTSSIYDMAESKGFTLVPYPNSTAFTLRDQVSPLEIPLRDEAAVEEFLHNFHRDLPDYTPLSDMPLEAVPQMPGAPQSIRQESWFTDDSQMARSMQHIEREIVEDVILGGRTPWEAPSVSELPGLTDLTLSDPTANAWPGEAPDGGAFIPRTQRGTLGSQFRAADRRHLAEVNEWLEGLYVHYGLPFRSLVLGLDERLGRAGVASDLYQQWQGIVSSRAVAHNDAIPYYQQYKAISTRFRRALKRNGHVMRVMELQTWDEQLAEMQRLGYRPGEIEAQLQLTAFYHRLAEYAGEDAHAFFRYISNVRSRQALGVQDPFADPQRILSTNSRWLAESMQESGVQMRELNIDLLIPLFVRGMTFQRHVAEPWNAMSEAWQTDLPIGMTTNIPKPIRMIIRNFLHNVKFGFDASYDPMVAGISSTLNTVFARTGMPFRLSNSDVRNFWRAGQMSAYRAMLGLKPHVIFRESINHYLAGVKLGFKPMNEVTYRYITDAGYRAEVRARGEAQGWRERGAVTLPTGDLFDPIAAANDPNPAVSETFAKIGDWIHDFSPRPLRGGIVGTPADPLYTLGNLGVFARTLAGETGWQVASRAIAEFRAGQTNRPELMRASKAAVWRAPVRERFQELIDAGQDEAAAQLIANEAASTVSRYGSMEHAYGLQGMGTAGRLAMGLGHFTTQHIQYLADGLLRGDVPLTERAAFLARYGLITASIAGASVASGWNFYKWMWGGSLMFTGGPAVEPAIRTYQLASATAAEMSGQYVTPEQRAAQAAMQNPSMSSNVFNSLFPYAGGIRTASGVLESIAGPNPLEATSRFLMTGDRSLRSDFGEWYEQLQVYPPGQGPGVPADTLARMMETDELRRRSGLPNPTGSF